VNLSDLVYGLGPSWALAVVWWLVALATVYEAKLKPRKGDRLKKRLKGFNWFILGSVYMYDHIFTPAPGEAKVLFRVAIGLVALGELAYHFDTLLNIAEVIAHKARRRVRHGQINDS